MALLSKNKRRAMIELYRYCSLIDDITDKKGAFKQKATLLKKWEEALKKNQTPLQNFNQIIATFALPKQELIAVIKGMYMDLEEKMILPTYNTLTEYCRYVAGAVGILSLHIFGCYTNETKKLAILLGEALQFTNILRDVKEDEKRGRLYIPKSFIATYMNPNQPIKSLMLHPNFHLAWRDFAFEAQKKFTECQKLFDTLKKHKTLWPARAMMLLYHKILITLIEHYNRSHAIPNYERTAVSFEQLILTARCAIGIPPILKTASLQ